MSLFKSSFYVRSSMFAILSLIGALFNYSLYPVLVHILDPSSFGNFAVIVAISNQVLGLLIAFNVISIYLVKAHNEEEARSRAQTIQKYLAWFLLVAAILTLIFSPYLNHLFKINGFGYFLVLAFILLVAVPASIWTGYLQGNKELIRVGSFNLSAALSKFIFSILLAAWFGAVGGLFGVLFGAVIGLAVLWFTPGVKLPSLKSLLKKSTDDERLFIASLKNYFIACLFVVGTLSFLQNFDILLAKALFSPSVAGMYSGISILSNALYYVCFLIIWIILPEIDIRDQLNNRRILSTGYKLLGAITVVAVVVELIFKDLLVKLLLGSNFSGHGNILIFATLYQLTLVAITLYAYFLLVNRQRRGLILVAMSLISCVALPLIFANSPLAMIQALWLGLIVSVATYWLSRWTLLRR